MATDANIKAVITADDRASSVLKNFGDKVDGVGGKVASSLALAARGFAIGSAAAGAFGVISVKAFSESEDMIAQTNAVLKSTGQIAGVTADQVTKLATSLQKTTKFSDEQVRSAENLLLTFTAIGKDIFPQATKTVLDMATALGEDTKSASIQLGKALQDPVLGITALRRVGVNFSDKQKDVIQALVDTGQKAQAQKLILKELQTEFGGSADAAGKTFAGSLAILKNQLNDVQETIGLVISQRLEPFINAASQAAASIDWAGVINRVINGLITLYGIYQSGVEIIKNVAATLNQLFGPSLEAVYNTIINRLLPSLVQLYNAVQPALTEVLKVLAAILGGVLYANLWIMINGFNVFIAVLGGVIRALADVIGWIGNLIGAIINIARQIGPAMASVAATIVAPFRSAFSLIASLWNSTIGKLSFHIPSWVPGLGGKGFDVPDIPMLAEGGIVSKPTLALIGEAGPEAVVPLNKSNQMGNVTIQINAGAFMGSDVEARKFAQIILSHLKDAAGSKNMTVQQMLGV